ncbi:hypothetical protein CH367_01075 [Leptospira barantonii]|uniref:Secreted protein n=1 Tax=Leptospira barantonii TaxID=2023184 RepID=A0ABX4NSU1_9LEPT|nr:hypothetical protein CH367_01075 [Leptospira barantonii]
MSLYIPFVGAFLSVTRCILRPLHRSLHTFLEFCGSSYNPFHIKESRVKRWSSYIPPNLQENLPVPALPRRSSHKIPRSNRIFLVLFRTL